MNFVMTDGGRAAAGFRGETGDCACRAIAVATGIPYQDAYDLINQLAASERTGKRKKSKSSARTGVYIRTMQRVMQHLGWQWTPTMQIGSGCTTHVRPDELPGGRLVIRLSKHYAAFIDGVLHDNHDCSRNGTRCVYGYWSPPDEQAVKPAKA